MKSKVCLAYCTFPSEVVANEICERLVSDGTVACANILGPIKSIYRWNDRLHTEAEVGVILKLAELKKPALTERIRAIHPYSVPALVFLPVEGGMPEFLNWVSSSI